MSGLAHLYGPFMLQIEYISLETAFNKANLVVREGFERVVIPPVLNLLHDLTNPNAQG